MLVDISKLYTGVIPYIYDHPFMTTYKRNRAHNKPKRFKLRLNRNTYMNAYCDLKKAERG